MGIATLRSQWKVGATCKAPMTVLAVKDRVTGHNPLAAVYLATSYYSRLLL